MNTHDLDTPCGFCHARGRRQIAEGLWLSAPLCADCGGTGYLVTSADGERLLGFLARHLNPVVRREIDALRTKAVSEPACGAVFRPP